MSSTEAIEVTTHMENHMDICFQLKMKIKHQKSEIRNEWVFS